MRTTCCGLVVLCCVLSFPALSQWSTTGNSGTTPGTNFIGTTSNVGLMFKTNSTQSGYIDIVNTNTSFGYGTMINNTTGQNNLAFGAYALVANTTGNYNVGLGRQTLQANTTGIMNTATGYGSLFSNISGNYNTAYGFQSLYDNTGSYNVVSGYTAGFDNTSGSSNTFIGYNTGRGITTGNYNTIIGASVTGLSASLSNHIILADGQGNQRLTIDNNGNMGLGTTTPTAQLHTTGTVLLAGLPNNTSPVRVIVSDGSGNLGYEAASSFSGGSSNWTTTGSNIYNANTGVVIIGHVPTTLFSDANLKLAVDGDIYTQKVVVTVNGWSDYVFDPGYKLPPLKELEAFVIKHRHLPDVPSTSEVEKDGIDVGANQSILLKKVEELSLYIIEQGKKTEAQQKVISDQARLLEQLQAELNKLQIRQQRLEGRAAHKH